MMGNVSGVSQFLETAALPGSQAATESAPSQNFAAVMQQTSNENGTILPVPGSGSSDVQAEQASSKTAAPSTQNASMQAANAAEKDALAQHGQRTSLQGKLQGSTGVSTKTVAGTASLSTKAVLPAATEGVLSKLGETAQGATAATPKAAVAPVAKGTSAATDLNTAATDEEAAAVSVAASIVAKTATSNPLAQASVVPQRAAKETLTVAGNQAAKPVSGKPGENKVDSKLTALVPQGTADVQQSDVALPVATVAAAAMPVLPDATISTGATAAPELTAALSSAGTLSPEVGPLTSARSVQGAASKSGLATAPAASAPKVSSGTAAVPLLDHAPVAADASQTLNLAASALQPAVGGTITVTPAQSAPAQATAAPVGSVAGVSLPNVAVGAASGPVAPVAQALPSQPADTAGNALPEQISTAVQGAIAVNAPPANAAAKPVLHSGRSAGTGGAAATSTTSGANVGSAAGQGVPPVATAPVQGVSAAVVPAVQASTANAGHTTAVAGDHKAAAKVVDPAVSGVAPLQGASQNKAAALDSSSTAASVAAKDTSDAVAAPAVALPAIALPATGGIVSTAAVVVPVSPLPHATAGAATNITAATGLVSAASESTGVTAAGGSLPHTTLSATPTSLEVGVASGTHGWLKIRAELNAAGEVNASLTGVNSAAATKLRGDLPALNSFLQDEKVQMGALDVRSALHATAFESGSTFSQAGSGQGGANGAAVSADAGAAGNRAQQQAQQGAESVPVLNGSDSDEVLPGRITDLVTYGNQTELGGSDGSSSVGYGAGGSWLNVRA